jgi:hypothetical protein
MALGCSYKLLDLDWVSELNSEVRHRVAHAASKKQKFCSTVCLIIGESPFDDGIQALVAELTQSAYLRTPS